MAAAGEKNHVAMIRKLASDLVKLYDFNGDGVVDREEYQSMIEDMAALQQQSRKEERVPHVGEGWFGGIRRFWTSVWARWNRSASTFPDDDEGAQLETTAISFPPNPRTDDKTQTSGSITITDLKLDLRRLVFGAIPLIKHITPGGPLILEPFTVTVNGSFNRGDIMESNLLDAGLRQLVGRALRRRVGSIRDVIEGSLFKGRSWKLISGTGPVVRVPKLTNVEFDAKNRLIITGRALVQSRPDGPVIENGFKLRTKIGTSNGGQSIRLVEPELALVLECPASLETKYVRDV